jgi:hypothetical protein
MKLNSASGVPSAFCLKVGSMCQFWGGKVAKITHNAVYHDGGAVDVTALMNTKNPKFVVGLRFYDVLAVCPMRHIAQVFNSVVSLDTIDMVDRACRGYAVHVQPRKPMCGVGLSVYTDTDVPSGTCPTSHHARFARLAMTNAPSKNSSFGIVIKKFADALWGKIGLSHAVVPYKQWFGQKPRRVDSTSGLRHFNGVMA